MLNRIPMYHKQQFVKIFLYTCTSNLQLKERNQREPTNINNFYKIREKCEHVSMLV